MSKKAIIGINGESSPFDETVDKLQTPGIDTNSVTWVPDDETQCVELNVTQNGTYTAASAGKYGYNFVTVSVGGSEVEGTINGVRYRVTVDENGKLVYTRI